ncbi:MAG TPA: tetratricopeptide repeat protein [Candidatus Limnocylindrales bacterium]|nr:tetratricopeptide repeat protein [Candidatus Limnocylindrales bacterium]
MRSAPLNEIEQLLERRDLKRAEIQLARYLREELQPAERADSLRLRARARLLSGRPDDALLDLKDALALQASLAESPEFLELRGDCQLARFELASFGFADRADTEQAASDYTRLLVLAPTWPNRSWVSYQQARICLSQNDMAAAMGHLQNALLSPGTLPALTAYCYERLSYIAFFDARNLTDALGYVSRAIATYPAEHPRVWLSEVYTLRSRILRASHDYTQALESADMALKIAGGCGPAGREALADAAQFAAEVAAEIPGRERDVVGYVQQFSSASRRPVGIDVAWSRAQELLGDAYLRAGLAAEALEAYQAALRHNPLHPEELALYFQIARCYYQLEDYPRAANAVTVLLRSADADEPVQRDFRVHALLASALYALGDYANSANAYRAALLHAPAHADGLDGLQRYYQDAMERSE